MHDGEDWTPACYTGISCPVLAGRSTSERKRKRKRKLTSETPFCRSLSPATRVTVPQSSSPSLTRSVYSSPGTVLPLRAGSSAAPCALGVDDNNDKTKTTHASSTRSSRLSSLPRASTTLPCKMTPRSCQSRRALSRAPRCRPERVTDAGCGPPRRRFLRARKFDVPKAKLMWIDTQKWRKSFKVDELYETFDYTEKEQVDALYPR